MVAFGTSGLRGLAVDLLAGPGYAHVHAFARHLVTQLGVAPGDKVFVGRDQRDSSPDLMRQSLAALTAAGLAPVNCGILPTPALANLALLEGRAAVMVTGSHIPPDRNGLKFYRPDGEIDKADERAIAALAGIAPAMPFLEEMPDLPPASGEALDRYVRRYKTIFPPGLLAGRRIGIYRHSSVAADILADLAVWSGAEIFPLGASGTFVAVDTEAIEEATANRLAAWSLEHRLDAIISTDGDGDRPLVADETGRIIRGDALGLIAALFLEADCVVTPVSSNPGIDSRFGFAVLRTKVGSPFVLEAMAQAAESGFKRIVGFEANGGLLVGTQLDVGGTVLAPLPTRDSVLPILCAFAAARRAGAPLSGLVTGLRLPVCLSGRVENFARSRSDRLMSDLRASPGGISTLLGTTDVVTRVDDIDGLQIHLEGGSMIHLRPSGNAPEMRCYVSAPSTERATALLAAGLAGIGNYPEESRGAQP